MLEHRVERSEPTPRNRWALVRGLSVLRAHWTSDWRSLARRNLLIALVILIVGFVVLIGASHLTARIASGYVDRGLQAWDERTLLWIAQHGPMSFQNAVLAESPGNLSYLIPLTTLVAIVAILKRRPTVAIAILVAYWGVRPIVMAGWWTWDRARPTLIADGIASPPLHSFPSGHAALAMAVYGLLAWLWIRSSRSGIERGIAVVLSLSWVTMVSVARVRLGSHWTSDIIAGGVLGFAWLVIVLIALHVADGGKDRAR